MATSLRADYSRRMERVAARITDHLANGTVPSLDDLAAAAALSPFHFHRIFRLLTGETVMEAITRLRIELATDAVANGTSTITQAAHLSGFASSQSLARAVRRTTGKSMSELISSGSPQLVAGEQKGSLKLEFLTLDPINVCSRTTKVPYDHLNQAFRGLAEALMTASGPRQIKAVYGVPIDDPRDVAPEDHRFQCCIALEPAVTPAGVDATVLGRGAFARQRVEATYAELPEQVDRTYLTLLDSGVRLRDAPTYFHYLDQPEAADGPEVIHTTDICVPIVAS